MYIYTYLYIDVCIYVYVKNWFTDASSASGACPTAWFHTRVVEGAAKSQFPPQGSGFQKSKVRNSALLNEFTPLQHSGVVVSGRAARSFPSSAPLGRVLDLRTTALQ